MDTKTINLRDLPEDFVRRAKAYAALNGVTLKELIIRAVEKAMQDQPASLTADTKQRKKK